MKLESWISLSVVVFAVLSSMVSSPTPGEAALVFVVGVIAFGHLGRPWTFQRERESISLSVAGSAAVLLIVGRRTGLDLLTALGCVTLLGDLLRRHLPEDAWPAARNRMLLLLFALPWLQTDAWMLGWGFRWTGAIVVENVLNHFGVSIQRQGTMLYANGIALDVAPACSGLRSLQLLLLAGIIAVAMRRGGRLPHWISPVVLGVSWTANTLRVLTLCIIATSLGIEEAPPGSALHETIGMGIAALGLIAIISMCPLGSPAPAVEGAMT